MRCAWPARQLAGILLLLIAASAAAWESQWLTLDEQTGAWIRNTHSVADGPWALPDISYAGYALGAQALGHRVPCEVFEIDAQAGEAIGDKLQAAIAAAGRAGGGVVRIPAGEFVLGRSVAVPHSQVSIEGAGSGKTLLRVPASYTPTDPDSDEGLLTLGRTLGAWRQGWWSRTRILARVGKPISEGAHEVTVADADALTSGQWVAVVQYAWPALAQQHSGGRWASTEGVPDDKAADRQFAFVYLRQIRQVTGRRVSLDAPIPTALDPANNPIVLRAPGQPAWTTLQSSSGISGMHIVFEDNANGPDGRPAGVGVLVDSMRDAWVHDVHVSNFPRHGIRVTHAARVTVSDSAVVDMQDDGSGGYGYGFTAFASQNILFWNNHAEETRHGFLVQRMPSSNVVFANNRSLAARVMGDGSHFGLAQHTAFDAHTVGYGTGLRLIYRGPKSGGAHETAMGGVVWNLQGDGHPGGYYGGALLMNPAAGTPAFVAGVSGMPVYDLGSTRGNGDPKHIVPVAPSPAMQWIDAEAPVSPGSANRNVAYEGIGRAGLQPQSLYQAQLKARSGGAVARFQGGCGVQPHKRRIKPRLYPGPGQLLFNSDHLAGTVIVSPRCIQCDADSNRQNATDGGAESLELQLAGKNWTPGAHVRGAWLQPRQLEALHLRVFSTREGQALRMTVGALRIEQWAPAQQHGETHIILDDLPVGRWKIVVIPAQSLQGPAFNTMSFSSVGQASTGAIYIDDVIALKRH